MDIDSEKLIIAVHNKSPLWDMKDKLYHSRDIQRKLWNKVAEELGSDGMYSINIFKFNYVFIHTHLNLHFYEF